MKNAWRYYAIILGSFVIGAVMIATDISPLWAVLLAVVLIFIVVATARDWN